MNMTKTGTDAVITTAADTTTTTTATTTPAAVFQSRLDIIRRCCLEANAHRTEMTVLQPFIAWNGVLTLALNGFPPSLERLKKTLNEHPYFAPQQENFGSRWPKITLGCLKTNDIQLTLKQLTSLSEVCEEFRQRLLRNPIILQISFLTLNHFANRSNETLLHQEQIALMEINLSSSSLPLSVHHEQEQKQGNQQHAHEQGKEQEENDQQCQQQPQLKQQQQQQQQQQSEQYANSDQNINNIHAPSPEQTTIVQSVLSEGASKNILTYLEKVQKLGNRTSHYRDHHEELTLVYPIVNSFSKDGSSQTLFVLIWELQSTIDAILPGYYDWFHPKSLHITIRSMQ